MLRVADELLHGGRENRLRGGADPTQAQRREARAWLERAAERGSAEAMIELALLHAHGGQTDRAQATEWLRRAAETGHLAGMRMCGECLGGGLSAPGVEGLHWLRRAAAGGDEAARWSLIDAIGARPDLREPGDDALAPASHLAFMGPWPATSGSAGLDPVLPAPGADPDEPGSRATVLAVEGRLDEATVLALDVLKTRPFDPRAACVLAACVLRRALESEPLNGARVALAAATLRGALEVTPDAPELHAANAVVEAWKAVIHGYPTWAGLAVRSAMVAAYLTGEHAPLAARVQAWLVLRGVTPPDEELGWTPAKEIGRLFGVRASRRTATLAARERDLEEALAHSPDDSYVLRDRARARHAKGDLPGADADLGHALEHALPRDRAGMQRERALVRHAAGDLDGAVAALDSAVAAGDDDQEALLHRGVVRWQRGDRAAAYADLEAAGADAWVAALGGGEDRRWRIVLMYEARRSDSPSVARLWLGLCTREELRARLDAGGAGDFGWRRAEARCHLGMHAERDGDVELARESYRACLAEDDHWGPVEAQ